MDWKNKEKIMVLFGSITVTFFAALMLSGSFYILTAYMGFWGFENALGYSFSWFFFHPMTWIFGGIVGFYYAFDVTAGFIFD